MATLALLATACQPNKDSDKTPISKPEITINGGRLTPEALWAMGRINSVLPNESTNQIAYTVSYYSVKENRSTSWIRIAKEEEGKLITINEFVGYEPSWIGDKIAYLKLVAILPNYHNKGIGYHAISQVIDMLRKRKYLKVALYTDQENYKAKACYSKCRFEVTETFMEEMANGKTVARCKMELVL